MKQVRVVIGAGYGDEGKGLMVDRLVADSDVLPWVVRFNGGAQAGHTVVGPDGRRHVFGHIGSGSFCGAPTWLSRFFVVHPMLFLREHAALDALGVVPQVLIDRHAAVTTPWDMLINQAVETARGQARHGSCGIGFGETIERGLDAQYRLTAGDLAMRGSLADRLDRIRREYFPSRLGRLGLGNSGGAAIELAASDALFEHYLDDVAQFLSLVELCDGAQLADAPGLVLEGAQGLLLDQDRGCFPHVTRSNTGLRNAIALASEIGVEGLDVTYMTRCYVTRHGAGPLAHEHAALPGVAVDDPTNRPNDWQGSLRFGWLDADVLRRAIDADLSDVPSTMAVRHGIGVTCLDQIGPSAVLVAGGVERSMSGDALVARVASQVDAATVWTSRGPSRRDMVPAERRTPLRPRPVQLSAIGASGIGLAVS